MPIMTLSLELRYLSIPVLGMATGVVKIAGVGDAGFVSTVVDKGH